MFEYAPEVEKNTKIVIMGVGGAGGNAIRHMIAKKLDGVSYLSVNTDSQVLDNQDHPTLAIGTKLTKGKGAGADPDIGKRAAEEERDEIDRNLTDADMLFIAAGMGGGTGTGAAPVIAKQAKDKGILTVAIVTTPFAFEGNNRCTMAEKGIQELEEVVDSLIVIPNDKILSVYSGGIGMQEGFEHSNDVLYGATRGIADLVTKKGMINTDFADVRAIMSSQGRAIMGTGVASGEQRAEKATDLATACPLLADANLQGAKGILFNITSDKSLSMDELQIIGAKINDLGENNANIIMGHVTDESMGDAISVSVIATGFPKQEASVLPKSNLNLGKEIKRHSPVAQVETSQAETSQVETSQVETSQAEISLEDSDDVKEPTLERGTMPEDFDQDPPTQEFPVLRDTVERTLFTKPLPVSPLPGKQTISSNQPAKSEDLNTPTFMRKQAN